METGRGFWEVSQCPEADIRLHLFGSAVTAPDSLKTCAVGKERRSHLHAFTFFHAFHPLSSAFFFFFFFLWYLIFSDQNFRYSFFLLFSPSLCYCSVNFLTSIYSTGIFYPLYLFASHPLLPLLRRKRLDSPAIISNFHPSDHLLWDSNYWRYKNLGIELQNVIGKEGCDIPNDRKRQ